MTSGMELRLERTAARVNVKALAKRMGRSRNAVHRYEGAAQVDATTAADYRRALASLTAEREQAA